MYKYLLKIYIGRMVVIIYCNVMINVG